MVQAEGLLSSFQWYRNSVSFGAKSFFSQQFLIRKRLHWTSVFKTLAEKDLEFFTFTSLWMLRLALFDSYWTETGIKSRRLIASFMYETCLYRRVPMCDILSWVLSCVTTTVATSTVVRSTRSDGYCRGSQICFIFKTTHHIPLSLMLWLGYYY